MDLQEIDVNMRNLVVSAQDRDYWSPYESGIEPTGSISHGVSYKTIVYLISRYIQYPRISIQIIIDNSNRRG